MNCLRSLPLLVILILLAPGTSQAQNTYQIQTIVNAGDVVQGAQISSDASFFVGPLNDKGQLLFTAGGTGGSQFLIQFAEGQLTPIAGAGGTAPGGAWPQSLFFFAPVSMNQLGQAAFAAPVSTGQGDYVGTFRMEYPSHQVSVVARDGMPAGGDLTFGEAGAPAPVINNRGELSFVAAVKNPAGVLLGYGVFFLGMDGKLQAVALPGQTMPDGAKVVTAYSPSLNDAGEVAFMAIGAGDPTSDYAPSAGRRAYLWQSGTITPLPVDRVTAPAGTLMLGFLGIWVNNQNQNVLLAVHLHSLAGHLFGLYQIANGIPKPVAVPGLGMPGGGRFLTLQESGVSIANGEGQHAFLALLDDGSTAAYRMDADGQLSLLLKSGTTTPLGKITSIGLGSRQSHGIGYNSKGQVGLTIQTVSGPGKVVLLTPTAP